MYTANLQAGDKVYCLLNSTSHKALSQNILEFHGILFDVKDQY